MIKLISTQKSAYAWEVDGVNIKLGFNLRVDIAKYLDNIKKYKAVLKKETYKKDEYVLKALFNYFGSLPFIRLGMEAFNAAFIKMCSYYCRQYIKSWYKEATRPLERIPSFINILEIMVNEDKGKCTCCFYMLKEYAPEHQNKLSHIIENEFAAFWGEKINECFLTEKGLTEIRSKVGLSRLTKYCMDFAPALTEAHIQKLASEYTRARETISFYGMQRKLFGVEFRNDYRPDSCDVRFNQILCRIIEDETLLQSEKFIAENHLELNLNNDYWKLYSRHGGNLASSHIDFTLISSPSLRLEVKHYMIHRIQIKTRMRYDFVTSISHAMNVLTDKNPSIKFIADISETDAKALHMYLETEYATPNGNKLRTTTIGNIFACCSVLTEYLMGDMRSNGIKSPRPHQNPFAKFRFVNLDDYKQNTVIIPEAVIEQLDNHINELNEHQILLYRIFSNTGMRLKEALFLEVDCIEKSRYENLSQIRFKPYKVIAARRKAGIGDYHRVLIPSELAAQIESYAAKTDELRKISGLPYIFLNARYRYKVNMISMCSFLSTVNKLIKKYNITEDGMLWHFTTRQYRKTIAVTLIENGATTAELAYWLGHLTTSTSMRYYAEVRKMKLAQLNTEFYRKQFELTLSSQQLEQFSEEERKLLYTDFRLGQRKVELGFCIKRLADGGCTERNSMYNCVNCKNLCTGKKYLPYWQELLNNQEQFLSELLLVYKQENISDYSDFKEFKQVKFLLECYQNMVKTILESEDE